MENQSGSTGESLVSFGLGGMTLGRALGGSRGRNRRIPFSPLRLSHDLFARTVRLERPETCPNLFVFHHQPNVVARVRALPRGGPAI
jgi:hypothetical protein